MDNLPDIIRQLLIPDASSDGTLLFWAKEILAALVIFGAFWVFSQGVTAFLNRWGSRLTSFTSTDLDDRVLKRITPAISLMLTFLGLYLAIRSLPLPEKLFKLLAGGLFIANVVIICVIIHRVIDEFLLWYVDGITEQGSGVMSRQMVPIVEKVFMLFIGGSALIVVLKHFKYDILSLVTALGVGSLAVGMAAKDTLAHMISGFTLMLDRPFRIGDRIQLSGGQIGDVMDIGLRSTKIKTLDNQLLIIPNSDLCNTMLINQAFPDVRVKGRINIGVAYGTDVEMVKELLVSVALEVDDVLRDPPPEAFFVSFGNSALEMSLFFWVEEYSRLFAATDRINSLILSRFSGHSIEIPFPTRKVLLEQMPQSS